MLSKLHICNITFLIFLFDFLFDIIFMTTYTLDTYSDVSVIYSGMHVYLDKLYKI